MFSLSNLKLKNFYCQEVLPLNFNMLWICWVDAINAEREKQCGKIDDIFVSSKITESVP